MPAGPTGVEMAGTLASCATRLASLGTVAVSSAIGAHNRHTAPELAARVVTAVEQRLVVVLGTAEAALDQQPW